MMKIESILNINGRFWGLEFSTGVAHTDNAALADKLRRKGYVVTDQQPEAEQTVAGAINVKQNYPPASPSSAEDNISQSLGQPDQPVAGSISKEHELSIAPSSAAQADTLQTVKQSEHPVSNLDISVSKLGPHASNTIVKSAKPRTTKSRTKAVKPHAADAG